jgi:Flp pilus assembly protein TadG
MSFAHGSSNFSPNPRLGIYVRRFLRAHGTILSANNGASAAEFALILPVMMLSLFAIIQFGIVINNYIEMTSGTSAGARVLSVSRGSATPYTSGVAAFNNAAPNITATVSMSVNGTACSADGSCATLLNGASGQPVIVSATYPCNLTIVGINFAPSCQLQSQTTERAE